jgi:hypothetical protein
LATSFVHGEVQSVHQLHWTMWFPPEPMRCYTHLAGLQFHSTLGFIQCNHVLSPRIMADPARLRC